MPLAIPPFLVFAFELSMFILKSLRRVNCDGSDRISLEGAKKKNRPVRGKGGVCRFPRISFHKTFNFPVRGRLDTLLRFEKHFYSVWFFKKFTFVRLCLFFSSFSFSSFHVFGRIAAPERVRTHRNL